MQRQLILVLATALSLLATTASATWSSQGGIEPDYPDDVTARLMFPDPDADPSPAHNQVYFNVVREPEWSGVNPNVAATGSHFAPPGFNSPAGWLGTWKDCNGDGYIGMAESAIVEYRSELINGGTPMCPAGTLHNKDGWVYEFIWIIDGAREREVDHIARYWNDSTVKMWGDSGRPPATRPLANSGGGGVCFVNPPVGFFSSTGSMIDYADCLLDRAIAETITQLDEGELCEDADLDESTPETCLPALNTGLGFEDTENPQCSESALNQKIGIWEPAPECPDRYPGYTGLLERYPEDDPSGNQRRAFHVWDCEGTQRQDVRDPRNESSILATAYVPGGVSPGVDGGGSVYEGANSTTACDPSRAAPYANPEAEVEQADAKVNPQYVFQYRGPVQTSNLRKGAFCGVTVSGQPVTPPPSTPVTDERGCTQTALLNSDTPQGLGVRIPHTQGRTGPLYYSNIATAQTVPFPTVVTRGTPSKDEPTNFSVAGANPYFYTYYASIAETGLVLPGGEGTYGIEWCGSDTDGVFGGFDCNADHWFELEYGGTAEPTSAGRRIGARPGDAYNLRDIDCMDGSVAGQFAPGVGLGLTLLSEFGPCPPS